MSLSKVYDVIVIGGGIVGLATAYKLQKKYSHLNIAVLEKEKALGDDIQITDIMDEVAGVYPKIMQEGTMDAGAWSCGMVAGLIHDIPTCKELVERIVADAEEIIKSRLSQFVA